MDRTRSLGRWIGGLSSAGVVGGSYVAVALVAVLSTQQAAQVGVVGAIALLAAHAYLRPTRRWEVFDLAVMPAIVSNLAAEVFGLPRPPIAYPLALLAVAILARSDRKESRSGPDAS